MKKVFYVVFLLLVTLSIYSITEDELDNDFNLSLTLTTINQLSYQEREDLINSGKAVILVGQISDIVHNVEEDFVLLEMLQGIWLSSTEVDEFKALLVCRGEEWLNYFPLRRSRNPHPNYTPVNSRVMVIANPSYYKTVDNGEIIPVLEVISLRIID